MHQSAIVLARCVPGSSLLPPRGDEVGGLKTNTKGGSACLQEKACFCFCFFLFQRPKMIISVLVTWMIVDCNLAVSVFCRFSCAL